MVKLVVLLRQTDTRAASYEQQYNDFLIKLDRLPGMRRKAVCHVYAGPGGFMPFHGVVEAFFDNPAVLQSALTSPAGVEAGQALLAFAGADAITLFADVMEESYPPA
jgi:uncharacterized protein (TIGR02118 family)